MSDHLPAGGWPAWSRPEGRGHEAARPNGRFVADLAVDGAPAYRFRLLETEAFLCGSSRLEQAQAWYWGRQWRSTLGEHVFRAEERCRYRLPQAVWLGERLVDRGLWRAVSDWVPEMDGKPAWLPGQDELPASHLSWNDIQQRFLPGLRRHLADCQVRLPREAECECACRAGSATPTWFGSSQVRHRTLVPGLDRIAWYAANSGGQVHPCLSGRLSGPLAANPYGFHDLLGNVYEWCADRWAVPAELADDLADGDANAPRPRRGGLAWCGASELRAARRGGELPAVRREVRGFRLCVLPSPQAGGAG